MINLSITADTPADLRKQLAELLGGVVPTQATITAATAQPNEYVEAEKRKGRPPKTSGSAVDTRPDESEKTEAGPADAAPEASDGPEELTYDTHIKPAILKVSAHPPEQGGGREGVLSLLAKHNVDHASKLSVEQYPAVLADISALLGEG